MPVDDEPGAQDNRLSLDPNDPKFAFAADWQDGQEYNVNLKVRQISPGELEVIEGTEGEPVEGADTETPAEDQAEPGEEAPMANGRTPAIQEAIARRYSK